MQSINMQEYYLDKIQKNISQIKKAQDILCQSIHEDNFNINTNYISNPFEKHNNVSNKTKNIFVDNNANKQLPSDRNLSMGKELKRKYINNSNINGLINDCDRYYNTYNDKLNNNEYKDRIISNNNMKNEDTDENMLKCENFKNCKNKLVLDNDKNNSNNILIEKNNDFVQIGGTQCFNISPFNNVKLVNYNTEKLLNKTCVKSDENNYQKNFNFVNNSIIKNKSILTNYVDKKDNVNNNITLLSHLDGSNNPIFNNKITCYKSKNLKKISDEYDHFINKNYIHNNLDKSNTKNIINCKYHANVDYSKNNVKYPDTLPELFSKNIQMNQSDKYNINNVENQNNLNNIYFYEGNDTFIKSENISNAEKITKNFPNFQKNYIGFNLQSCNDEHIRDTRISKQLNNHTSIKNLNNYCRKTSEVLCSMQLKDKINNSRENSLRKKNLQPIIYNYENGEIRDSYLMNNDLKISRNVNYANKLYSPVVSPHCTYLSNSEKENSYYSIMFKKEDAQKIHNNENFTTKNNFYKKEFESVNLQLSKNKTENIMETKCNFQNYFQKEKTVKRDLLFQKESPKYIVSEAIKKENYNNYNPFVQNEIRSSTLLKDDSKSKVHKDENTEKDRIVITNNVNYEAKSTNDLEKDNSKEEKDNENAKLCNARAYDTNTSNNCTSNIEIKQISTSDSLREKISKDELCRKQDIEVKQDSIHSTDFKYICTNKNIFEKREEKENNIIKNNDGNITKCEEITHKEQNRQNNKKEKSNFDFENIINIIKEPTKQIHEEENDVKKLKTDTQGETLKESKEQMEREQNEQQQLKRENINEKEQFIKNYTEKKTHMEIEEISLESSDKVPEMNIDNYNTSEAESNSLYIKGYNGNINEKKKLEKELELYFKKEGFLISSNLLNNNSEKDENDLCYSNESKKKSSHFSDVMKSMNTAYSEKEYEISSNSIDIFEDDIFLENFEDIVTNRSRESVFCTNESINEIKKKDNKEKKNDYIENKINISDISNNSNSINTNCKTIKEENNDDNNHEITEKNYDIDFFLFKNKNLLFMDLLKNKNKHIRKGKCLEDKLENKYNILIHPNSEEERNLIDKIIYCLDPSYVNNTLDEKIKWKQKLKYMQEKFLESILCVSYPNHLWNETNFEAYIESLNFNSLLDDTFIKYQGDLNINLFQEEEEIFSDAGNIGEGGFGVVTKMRFLTGSKYYAIKKISKDHIIKSQAAGQAYLEAKYHSVLSHVNIIKMYGCMQDDQYIYHILEFCSKGSIYSISKNFKKRIIPDELAYKYFCHIVNGLYYLNQMGIFHRDIKMENVLVDHKDNAKLSDFGLSAMILGTKSHSSLCGTLVYFSPEITSGTGYDWRSDIWSLGVLLYEMLVGDVPFDGTKTQIVESIFSCDLKFPDFVNPLAINLIKKTLVVDANKRIKLCELSSDPWMQEMWKIAFQKDLKKNKDVISNINEESKDFNFISNLIKAECFIKSSLNASLNFNMNQSINENEISSIKNTKSNIDSIILETQNELADYLDLEDFFMKEENIYSSDDISESQSDGFTSHLSNSPTDIKNEKVQDNLLKENKMDHKKEFNECILRENYGDKEFKYKNIEEKVQEGTLKMNENIDLINSKNENIKDDEKYIINKNEYLKDNENLISKDSEYKEVYSDNIKIDIHSKVKEVNTEDKNFHFPIKNNNERSQKYNEEADSKDNSVNNDLTILNNNDSMSLKELNNRNIDSNATEENTENSSINDKLDVMDKKNEDKCIFRAQNNQEQEIEPKIHVMEETIDSQKISNVKNLENVSNNIKEELDNVEIKSEFLEKHNDTLAENKSFNDYNDKNYPFKDSCLSRLSSLSNSSGTNKKYVCEKLEIKSENNDMEKEKSKNTEYDTCIKTNYNKNVSITHNENYDTHKVFINTESKEKNDNNKNMDDYSIDISYKSNQKNGKFNDMDESYIPISVLKKKIGEIINENNSTKINLELRESFLHDNLGNVEDLNKNSLGENNIKNESSEKLKRKILDIKSLRSNLEIKNDNNKINNFNNDIFIYKNAKNNYENEKNANERKDRIAIKPRCFSEKKLQNKREKNCYIKNIDASITKEVATILEKTSIGKYYKRELFKEKDKCEGNASNYSNSVQKSEKKFRDNIFFTTETKNDDVHILEDGSLYDKYIDKINKLYQNIKNKKLINDVENIKNGTSENDKIINKNDNINFENNKKGNEINEIMINNYNNESERNSFSDYYYNNRSNKYFKYNRNSIVNDYDNNNNDDEINRDYINKVNKDLFQKGNLKNIKLNGFRCTKESHDSKSYKNKEILSNNDIFKREDILYMNRKDEECLDDKLANFKEKITNDPNSSIYIAKKEKTFLELKQKIHINNLNIKPRITPDFVSPNMRNIHSNSENGYSIIEKNRGKYFHMNENSLSSSNSDYSSDRYFYRKNKRCKSNSNNSNILKYDRDNYRDIKNFNNFKNKIDNDRYQKINTNNNKKVKDKENNVTPLDVSCFDNKVTFMASESENKDGNTSKVSKSNKIINTQKNNLDSKKNLSYKISNLELVSRIHKNKLNNALDDQKKKKKANNSDENGSKKTSVGSMNQRNESKSLMKRTFNLEINAKSNEMEKIKFYKKGEHIMLKDKKNDKNEIFCSDSVTVTKRNASMKTTFSAKNNILEKESDIRKNKRKGLLDLLYKNEENTKLNELINDTIIKDNSKSLEKEKLNLISDKMILNMEQKNELCTFNNVDNTKANNTKCKLNEIFLENNSISTNKSYHNILFNKDKNKKKYDDKSQKDESELLRSIENSMKGKNICSEKINGNIDIRNNYRLNKKRADDNDNNNTKESYIVEKNFKSKISNMKESQDKFCNNILENSLVHENTSISTMNIKDKINRKNCPSKDLNKNNINFVQKNKKSILETDLKNSKMKQYLRSKIEKIKNNNDSILSIIENEKSEHELTNIDFNNNASNSLYHKKDSNYEEINNDTDVNEGKISVSEFSFSSNSKKCDKQKNYELKGRNRSAHLQKGANNNFLETQNKNNKTKTLSRSKSESIKYFHYSSTESDTSLSFNSIEKNEICELDKFHINKEKKKKKNENKVEEFENNHENSEVEEANIRNKNIKSNISDIKNKNTKKNLIYTNICSHRKINFSNIKSKINTNIYKKSKNEGDVLNDKENMKLSETVENNRRAKSAKIHFKSNDASYNKLNLNSNNSITLKDKMKKKNNLINSYDSKKKEVIRCKRLNSLPVNGRLANDSNNKIKRSNENSLKKNESVRKMKTSYFKNIANTKYEEELQNKLLSLNKKKIYANMKNSDKNNINNYNNYYSDCIIHDNNKTMVRCVSSNNNNNNDGDHINDNCNVKNFYENNTCNKHVSFNGENGGTILCNNQNGTLENRQNDEFNLKNVNFDEKEKFNYNRKNINLMIDENNNLIYRNNYFYDKGEDTSMKECCYGNYKSSDLNKVTINNIMNNNNNTYLNKIDRYHHMNPLNEDTNLYNTNNQNEIYINERYKTNEIYFNNLDNKISSTNINENNNVIKRNNTGINIMNIKHVNSMGSENGFINIPTNTIYTYEKKVNNINFNKSTQNNEIYMHYKDKKNIQNEKNKLELQMKTHLNTNIDEHNTYILPSSVQNRVNSSYNTNKSDEQKENTRTYCTNYLRKASKINNNVEDIKGKKNEVNMNRNISTIFKFAKNTLLKSNNIKNNPSNNSLIHLNVNSHSTNNQNDNIPKSSCNNKLKSITYFHHDEIEKERNQAFIKNHENNSCSTNYNIDMLNKGLVDKSFNCSNSKCVKMKNSLSIPNNINISHRTLGNCIYDNSEKKSYSLYTQKNKGVRHFSTNVNKINCENHSYEDNKLTNYVTYKKEKMNSNYNTEKKKIRIAINKHGKNFFVNSSINIIK